jgi:hypothetical protein
MIIPNFLPGFKDLKDLNINKEERFSARFCSSFCQPAQEPRIGPEKKT